MDATRLWWWLRRIVAVYLILGALQGATLWWSARGGWDCAECAYAALWTAILWGWWMIT
jgi:hypothetical protein